MERQEMVFGYDVTGCVELEEMETVLRVEYGLDSEVEFYDDCQILVWYE